MRHRHGFAGQLPAGAGAGEEPLHCAAGPGRQDRARSDRPARDPAPASEAHDLTRILASGARRISAWEHI